MATFRFSLEAVLTHRRSIERESQLALAAIERERLAIENEIRGYQIRLDRERLEWRVELGGGVDVRAVRHQASAAVHVVALAQRAALRLAGVLKRQERARQELIEAARKRKAVEMLRERKHEEWRKSQERQEAAATDELAVIATARRLAEGLARDSQEMPA